jgi:hypothetical protein
MVFKAQVNIPFMGTVGASTQLTLVSGMITFPFKIVGAEITFRDDAANSLRIYVLVSANTNTSTTDVPPDTNAFSQYSPTPYFVGEGTIKRASCFLPAFKGGMYIKVHANNLNAYAQTINATVTIEAS